ncbi:hypothetical protein MHBO_000345 [Bonamia ostreae]|uniref:Uncharacterized protein n=1 Tax=Bonamia ostreae TaxID=126728 RepID=A0ABV2AFC9_9EUKA
MILILLFHNFVTSEIENCTCNLKSIELVERINKFRTDKTLAKLLLSTQSCFLSQKFLNFGFTPQNKNCFDEPAEFFLSDSSDVERVIANLQNDDCFKYIFTDDKSVKDYKYVGAHCSDDKSLIIFSVDESDKIFCNDASVDPNTDSGTITSRNSFSCILLMDLLLIMM